MTPTPISIPSQASQAKEEARAAKEEANAAREEARAAEEERRRAEEARRQAEKRLVAEASAAAKAAEDDRWRREQLSVAEAKAEAEEALRRRADAAAVAAPSHAASITTQRLERAQSRGGSLLRRSRQSHEAHEAAEGVVSHTLMCVKTSAAAEAIAAPKAEEKTSTAPRTTAGQQTLAHDPSYVHPAPPPWLHKWRRAGAQSAPLDASSSVAGFVADNLAVEGDTIVVADGQHVSVYSASSEEVVQTLSGHTDQVCSVAIQGDRIASGSRDHAIRLWSASTGACTAVLVGCEELVCGLALDGDHLVSGEGRGAAKVRMWSVGEAQQTALFDEHTGPVWSVAIGASVVVSASQDTRALIWPRTATSPVATGPTASIGSLSHPNWVFSISVDDDMVATGCRDGCVRLWSLATLRITRTLSTLSSLPSPTPSPIYSVRLVRGVLVTGAEDKTIKFWSLAGDGECICTLHHTGAVRGLALSPTGSFAASAGGKKVALWRPS